MGVELKTRFTADTSGYDAAIARLRKSPEAFMAQAITRGRESAKQTTSWWTQAITAGKEDQKKAAVAAQNAVDASVEAATRRNRARSLLRERGETRREARVTAFQAALEQERAGMASGTFVVGGRGRGGRFGGRAGIAVAGSMFTSVARDSAASLASGAPISQVIAQQAPQVLQALSMMRLGFVGLGIAAAGAATYGLFKFSRALYDAVFETDRTTRLNEALKTFQARVEGIRKTAALANLRGMENRLAEFNRREDQARFANEEADAEKDLEKAKIKNAWLNRQKDIHHQSTKERKQAELELEKQLLAVDIARAKAKEDAARAEATAEAKTKKNKEVTEAEIKLGKVRMDNETAVKKAEEERNEVFKDRAAAMNANRSFFGSVAHLTPEQQGQFRRRIEDADRNLDETHRENANRERQAQLDLEAARKRVATSEDTAAVNKAEADRLGFENQQTSAELSGRDSPVKQTFTTDSLSRAGLFTASSVLFNPTLNIQKTLQSQLTELRGIREQLREGGSNDWFP